MKDPEQSTPRIDTLKVVQLIGVQTVIFGASNTHAIHEDIDQLRFSLGCHLDQVWSLLKVMTVDEISKGQKLDAIRAKLEINTSAFTVSQLTETFAALVIEEEERREGPTVMVYESIVKAYQYTSITSVTLLDCWTIPWVLILTRLFIKTKYTLWQIFGAITCIAGLVVVLFSDVSTSTTGGSKPILGDALVIAGTIFYALSNVGEEFCVKKRDRVEVVAMLGIFGALISGIQLLIFERKELESLEWSFNTVLLFLGFGVSLFSFYTFVPFLLQMSGATLFNLSLLTSDMWAVVIRIFFYHQAVDWLYYVAFGIVAIGLTIYSFYDEGISTSNPGYENDQAESIPYVPLHQDREASLQSININQN